MATISTTLSTTPNVESTYFAMVESTLRAASDLAAMRLAMPISQRPMIHRTIAASSLPPTLMPSSVIFSVRSLIST